MANLTGTANDDTLTGTSGNDTISGGAGNDSLLGLGGADTLIGDAGNDILNGGLITDNFLGTDWNFTTYSGATAGVNINLSGVTGDGSTGSGTATGDTSVGTDTLIAINLIQGSGFNDTIIGSTALVFEQFEGGAGNDYLDGGAITDSLNGENGNRVTYHNALGAGVTVDLMAGTAVGAAGGNVGSDTLINFNQVRGSNFADTLLGSNRTDMTEQFEGRLGNDYIDGRGGFDIARYGSATTQVVVNLVTGLATGAMGNDTLVGIEGVRGGTGDDILTGGNALNGTVWNDGLSEVFRGDAGNDTIDGGQGYDRVDYDNSTSGVVVKLNNTQDGSASDGLGGTDVLRNIEAVRGSMYGDVLTGSNGAVFESFEGREGNDTINGAGGVDRADYHGSLSGVTVNLTTGVASDGYGGTDSLSNIENVRGSRDFNDTLTGSAANNFLQGQGGDDWFNASAGSDTLDGGTGYDRANYRNLGTAVTINMAAGTAVKAGGGTDTLIGIERVMGSAFADSITGSAADDDFSGNAGNDTMDGGAGYDFVWYGSASGAINVNLGTGVVTGGDGTDTLISIEAISGTNFADTIVGSTGDDYMRGDVDIFGTPPSGSTGDSLVGGAGFDVLDYRDDPAAVSVNLQTQRATDGRGGQDTIEGFEEARGSAFNDVLTGSTNLYFERFEGRTGDDTIDGGLITDTLNQMNANQASYRLAGAAVRVDLAAGTATGGAGNDVLININEVRGSAFNDTLIGSDRTDLTELFEGREGNDSIDGGGGFDIVRFDNATGGVTASLLTGTATGAGVGSDVLTRVEGIFGSAYADVLSGGLAANGVVYNDGLSEVFRGGAGNDTIDGGQGYDRADYTTSSSGVVVTLNDSLAGSASDGLGGTDVLRNIEAVRGSAFGDQLTGSNTAVFESFEGREGNDSINGNGGVDRADYRNSTAAINVNLSTGVASDGYGGTDSLTNIENVRGSRDFNDVITGSTAANYLQGLGGNDTLVGGDGDDTLAGGLGDDSLSGGSGLDTATYADATGAVTASLSGSAGASGADGIDTLSSIENLIGSAYADILTGSTAANSLSGGAGNDSLNGGAGADTLLGGLGDDQYTVDNIGDVVTENSAQGLDTVLSSISYTLGSNVENLRLSGSAATNATGNSQANLILGNAADNIINGASGTDTVSYNNISGGVTVSLAITTAQATGSAGSDTLISIENLVGSNYADKLTGSSTANRIEGGIGNDSLDGGAGADTLLGGTGDDQFTVDNTGDVVTENTSQGTDTVFSSVSFSLGANIENLRLTAATDINATGNSLNNILWAGAGNNVINGSSGVDAVSYSDASGGVTINLTSTTAQATGGSGSDTLLNIENLVGSSFADSFTGGSAANAFTGGDGNDSLDGAAGNDTLSGGVGNDHLTGGKGQDQMSGGAGADFFDFYLLSDMGSKSSSWDIISDFNGAEGDRIDLSTLDANTLLAGDQAFSFIGSASFTAAGQLRYDTATGMLYGSVDADATAEFAIQLVGSPAFVVGDLIA